MQSIVDRAKRVRALAPAVRIARRMRRRTLSDDWPQVASVEGWRLHYPRKFHRHYVGRPFEPLSSAFMAAHVHDGSVAVDVGAHVGLVTLRLARLVGRSGRVFAVEPAAENLRYLRRNLRANGIRNVEVLDCAASGRDGFAEFHITGSSDSHGLFEHPNTATSRIVEVRVARLDGLVRAPLGFFKVDTEGAEVDALQGMLGLLEVSKGCAGLVEWTPSCQEAAGRAPAELIEFLRDLQFDLEILDDANGVRTSVEAVLDAVRGRSLPGDWYANIACMPGESRSR